MVITIDTDSELDDTIIIPQGWRFSHPDYAVTIPVSHGGQSGQHWDLIGSY